jgi:hypothetical protein
MERTRQVIVIAAAAAVLFAVTAWLFRTPETSAVHLPPVAIHR